MSLNKDKFELICFKPTTRNANLVLLDQLPFNTCFNQYETATEILITPSNCAKDLGVFIHHNLDWDSHIINICKKAKQLTAWILNVFYTRNKTVMLTLFNSLVLLNIAARCGTQEHRCYRASTTESHQ